MKLDDLGMFLTRAEGAGAAAKRSIGNAILVAAPWLMKALSVAGTAAMFLVGGGILSHGVPPLHHAIEALAQTTGPLAGTVAMLIDGLLGIAAGALVQSPAGHR